MLAYFMWNGKSAVITSLSKAQTTCFLLMVQHVNIHLTSLHLDSEQQVQRGVLALSISLLPLGLVLSRYLIPVSSISGDQSPSSGETLDSFLWLPPHLAICHRSNGVPV